MDSPFLYVVFFCFCDPKDVERYSSKQMLIHSAGCMIGCVPCIVIEGRMKTNKRKAIVTQVDEGWIATKNERQRILKDGNKLGF